MEMLTLRDTWNQAKKLVGKIAVGLVQTSLIDKCLSGRPNAAGYDDLRHAEEEMVSFMDGLT